MDAEIASFSVMDAGTIKIVVQILSTLVSAAFIIKEAGIYALDPDDGTILYAYVSMHDDPVTMLDENSTVGKMLSMEISIAVSSVSSITAAINPSALVRREELDNYVTSTVFADAISGKVNIVSGAITNNIPKFAEGGQIADSGIKITDVVAQDPIVKTASFTLELSQANKIIDCNNTSDIIVTIPTFNAVAIPKNTVIAFSRVNVGNVSFAAAVGVTLESDGDKTNMGPQNTPCALRHRDTNVWQLVGYIA
jgi:hypothetical protein